MSATVKLYAAAEYALDRIQTDPDVRYYCGWGTEMFHLLCVAEAAHLGLALETVEASRRVDLQPVYRKRDPRVVELQERVRALEEGL